MTSNPRPRRKSTACRQAVRGYRGAAVALSIAVLHLIPVSAGALTLSESRLPNGLRILYGESHASGLVAAAAFVGAGAARETEGMNGAAHFLEHLLFNGTTQRTQEELYRDTDLIGAYSNATTRRDHVVYLMVVGAEDLDGALEIQSDMLFHSVLPPDKFEKERGIILEELARSRSNRSRYAGEELTRLLGQGTADALPILGTEESIASLDRDAVHAYYQELYVPANMTLLVLGDFIPEQLLAAIGRHFGSIPGGTAPPLVQRSAPSGVLLHGLASDRTALRIRLPGPAPEDSAFAALLVLEDLLAGEAGRLRAAMRRPPELAIHDIGTSVSLEPGKSYLEIEAAFDSTTSIEDVAGRALGAVAEIARDSVPEEELAFVRTRRAVSEALASEQIHYMAFTRAEFVLHAPFRYVGEAEAVLAAVSPDAVAGCATMLMTDQGAVLAAVGPGLPTVTEDRDPRQLAVLPPPGAESSAAVTDPLAGGTSPSRADEDPTRSLPPRVTAARAPITETLANGITLVLAANPDSDVLAMHLAARGRTYCEPPQQSGIADLLHRSLLLGAGSWSREELGREIDQAGLQIKVTDNPGIPYDDYQTRQEYSFIRLETADRFYRNAFSVLAEMIRAPRIDDEGLAEVRAEAIALAQRRETSASEQSQLLLRREFYPDSELRAARPPLGTAADLAQITVEDLRRFHASYFAPENLVIAIVTGLDPDSLLAAARAEFMRLPAGGHGPCARWEDMFPTPTTEPARVEVPVGSEQSWIRLGSVFPVAPADAAALEVSALVLSGRIAFELRERQGLAYAIGAAYGQRGDRAWVTAGMGTRPENLEPAEAGLTQQLREFAASDVTDDEVTKEVKSHLGRLRMRRVTRINQAMGLCLNALSGSNAGEDAEPSTSLSAVKASDVQRVAQTYLSRMPLVTAIAR